MSDYSDDSDYTNEQNEFVLAHENNSGENLENLENDLFEFSIKVQKYCQNNGLPIFNVSQVTALLFEMYYQ